jgi:two-component system, response regulator YesN
MNFCIINIACELFEPLFINEGIDLLEDHVLIVLNDSKSLMKTKKQKIKGVIKDIFLNVEKHLEINLQCCISSSGSSLNKLSALYSEVLESSNYFIFDNKETIIWCEEFNKLSSSEYAFPVDKNELLIESIKLGNEHKAVELYLDIVNSTLDYSFNVFNTTIFQLGLSLNLLIQSLNQYKGISIPFNLNGFISDITKKETFEEINEMFLDKIHYIILSITQINDCKYDKLIKQINNIIDKKYRDINLSVQMLADEVNTSPVYLGQLYKKLTTNSIHDVINEKRIEKAKDLIQNTDTPISEIALKSGFSNKTYFYTLFKKVHGITPMQYRKQ